MSGKSNFKFSYKPCYADLSCRGAQETQRKIEAQPLRSLFGWKERKDTRMDDGEKEKGQAFLLILDGLKNITPEKGVDPPLP